MTTRLASCLVLAWLTGSAQQDEWRSLPLERVEAPADSAASAGLAVSPDSGAIIVVLTPDNACDSKVTASYQARGAVVKVRLDTPSGGHQCTATDSLRAFQGRVHGLKHKRYQVIVYTKNRRDQWQPWKAAVTTVP